MAVTADAPAITVPAAVSKAHMEAKLNEMLEAGDYYSAHQLILSLSKRKSKSGKDAEAVSFTKNGVLRLCSAKQFASASDAACDLLEHSKVEDFSAVIEMFKELYQSPESQYWRALMTALNSHNLLDSADNRSALLKALMSSPHLGYDGEKLSSVASLALSLTNSARLDSLAVFAAHLAADTDKAEIAQVQMYFVTELSLALTKAGQFEDCDAFLRAFHKAATKGTADVGGCPESLESSPRRLYNFCVLLSQLCQRRNPTKSILTDLLNEYLPEKECRKRLDLAKLRSFAETSLLETYWPAPKGRMPPGGAPADLMNMIQGLLGPQAMRR